MVTRYRSILFAIASTALIGWMPLAQGTGGATLTVAQQPATGFTVLGEWVLLKPDGTRTTTNVASHAYEDLTDGNYLLNVMPPSGMSAEITLTINGVESTILKPQVSFGLVAGDQASLVVHYQLVRAGKVSVDTDPPGLAYTLSGPDSASYEGLTPGFYDPMPEGLYSVTIHPITGCNTPPPQSGRLVKDSRVVFSVHYSCDKLSEVPQQKTANMKYQFVEALIDGQSVYFEDVPMGQWFSAPIRRALDAKVMSGYRNAEGNPTGMFGPSDPVTVAELSKIALRLAGIDELKGISEPENERARNSWFSPFVASAEQLGWLVFLNRAVDPLRPATRAEVAATFLQALNVDRKWPTGEMFTDVSRTIPYADCVETAAAAGLVAGRTDAAGASTHLFAPFDQINRAEMAKMIATAMDLYLEDTASFQPD